MTNVCSFWPWHLLVSDFINNKLGHCICLRSWRALISSPSIDDRNAASRSSLF